MKTERLYIVSFDTQRDKVYRCYEYPTYAPNKKAAIDEARYLFACTHETDRRPAPHMFHCYAERAEELPCYHTLRKFKVMEWKPVTWGRR